MSSPACQRWMALFEAALLGEALDDQARQFLGQHVQGCEDCAREASAWREVTLAIPSDEDSAAAAGSAEADAFIQRFQAARGFGPPPQVIDLAQRRRRLRAYVALAAAACLAVAIGATLRWTSGAGLGEGSPVVARAPAAPGAVGAVERLEGGAQVAGSEARQGLTIAAGEVLSTAAGRLCVRLEGKHQVCLYPRSSLRVLQMDARRRELQLDRGGIALQVEPLAEGAPFTVSCALGSVEVLGTTFAVTLAPAGDAAQVDLVQGLVRLRGLNGESALLRAGHSMTLGGAEPWPMQTTAREAMRLALGPLTEAPAEVAAAARPPAIDSNTSTGDLDATAAPEQASRAERRGHDGSRRRRSAGQKVSGGGGQAPSEPAEAMGSAPGRAPSAQAAELLQQARKLRAEGRHGDAAATYRKLQRDYPDSREAHASYALLGELELTSLGRPKAALRSFQRYLEGGAGTLTSEAMVGAARAYQALGRTEDERRAIEAYLRRFPDDLYSARLRQRLQQLEQR